MSKRYDAFVMANYNDRDGNQKTRWLKAGAAFVNADASITVVLDALPVAGRLQLRVPLPPKPWDGDAEETL